MKHLTPLFISMMIFVSCSIFAEDAWTFSHSYTSDEGKKVCVYTKKNGKTKMVAKSQKSTCYRFI